MKTPEYVATIVKYYRDAIDKALAGEKYNISQVENQEIAQVFSRDFTDSYLFSKSGKDMMNVNKPNNRGVLIGRVQDFKDGKVSVLLKQSLELGDKLSFWTTVAGRVNISVDRIKKDGIFVERAEGKDMVILDIPKRVNQDDRVFKIESSSNKRIIEEQIETFKKDELIPLNVKITGKIGEKLIMEFFDDDGFISKVTSEIILEEALKHPLNEESIKKQMRLGDTQYYLNILETKN
jgi:putative protease